MNKLNYEILSAIDNIDNTIMESEMNVMNSLINSYDKAITILENCNDNTDVDAFDIFQESVIMEAKDNKASSLKSNKQSWFNRIIELFKQAIEKLKELLKPIREKINKFMESLKNKFGSNCQIKVVCDFNKIISTMKTSLDEYFKFLNDLNTNDMQTTEGVRNVYPRIEAFAKTEDINNTCDHAKEVIDDFTNNNKFEIMDCDTVLNSFDDLGKITKKCLNRSNIILKELDGMSIKLLNGMTPDQFIHNTDVAEDDLRYFDALSNTARMLFYIHNEKVFKSVTTYSDLTKVILSPKNINEIR